MTTLSLLHFTLDDVRQSIKDIDDVLYSPYGVQAHRLSMTMVRDNLHAVCERMEQDYSAEAEDEVYLCLFDALAFITEALRAGRCLTPYLLKCRDTLANMHTLMGEQTS